MDSKTLEIFSSAAADTMREMFSMEATPGKPVEMDHLAGHAWEISSVIGITGKGKGMLVLRFHKKIIMELLDSAGMTPSSPEEEEEMVTAFVGEIANVVSGHSINVLPYDLDITVPLIVQGLNHKINWPKFAPVYAITVTIPLGQVELAVCFAPD